MEDFHATREAPETCPPKRTSITSKHYLNPYSKEKEKERDISFADPHNQNAFYVLILIGILSWLINKHFLIYFFTFSSWNWEKPARS